MWAIAIVVAFCLAFAAAADDATPPIAPDQPTTVVTPPMTVPGPPPTMGAWPCKEYDSQEGVRGRLNAVPVNPADRC